MRHFHFCHLSIPEQFSSLPIIFRLYIFPKTIKVMKLNCIYLTMVWYYLYFIAYLDCQYLVQLSSKVSITETAFWMCCRKVVDILNCMGVVMAGYFMINIQHFILDLRKAVYPIRFQKGFVWVLCQLCIRQF